MQRFFSYERVSSAKQATGGKGLQRQAGDADAWCAAKGVELDQSLTLADEGRSAFHGDHLKGALGQFLDLAQKGELGEQPVLLVEAIDRLSRQEPLDGLQDVLLNLVRSGVCLVSLEDGQEYSRATLREDGTKLVMLALKAQAAHEYSKRLSRRITSSWDAAYAELEAGRLPRGDVFLPPWCKRDGEQIKLVPEMVATIQRIFEEVIDDGHTVIAGRLNADKVPTLHGKRNWTRTAVKAVLEDVRVLGQVRINYQRTITKKERARRGARADNERIFDDLLPVIITPDQMQLAKAAIAARSNPKNGRGSYHDTNYIGQGLSRCICGAIVGTTTTSSGRKAATRKVLRYAKCRHRVSHRDGCRGLGYRLDELNGHLLARLKFGQLQQLIAADAGKSVQIKAEEAAISRLQAQLAQAKEAEGNASKLFKEALKSGQVDALFKEAVDEARSDSEAASRALSDAQTRLAGLRHEIDSEEFDAALKALFDAFHAGNDTPKQRRAINLLMQRSGLKVTLDNKVKRVGMSIGDGPIDWQPLDAMSVQMALTGYQPGVRFMAHTITDELIQQAIEAGEDPEIVEIMQQQKGIRMVGITNKP